MGREMIWVVRNVCLSILVLAWSCGTDQQVGGPLIRIGDVEIDDVDLRVYKTKLPPSLQSAETGVAAIRDLLQSLVDREIMILEAESKGYHRDPELSQRLHGLLVKRLVERLLKQEISERARVSEEELQQVYEKYHWDRRHRPAHILSATEEDAWEVVEALKQGRDFAELARERSLSKKDAMRGGDLMKYFGPEDVASAIFDAVGGLEPGQFSDPIKTRDGYDVVKVLDVVKVSLESVRGKLSQNLYREKFLRERSLYVQRLEEKHGVLYRAEGIKALSAAAELGTAPTSADSSLPLLSIADRAPILLGTASRHLMRRGQPLAFLTDSLAVVRALRNRVVADTLLWLEAHSQNLHQDPEFLDFQEETYRKLLIRHLRKKDVLAGVEISEEEIRREYAKDEQRYAMEMTVSTTEILVDSKVEATQIVEQGRAGADWDYLVSQNSLRPGAQQSGGHLHLGESTDDPQLKALLQHAAEAAIGELVGPVQVEEGWSVFRVDQRREAGVRPLEEVEHLVRFKIRKSKEREAFEDYIRELRKRYADRVQWNDAGIEALASSGNW